MVVALIASSYALDPTFIVVTVELFVVLVTVTLFVYQFAVYARLVDALTATPYGSCHTVAVVVTVLVAPFMTARL